MPGMTDATMAPESLLAAMTLDEKCAFVAGRDLWHTPGCERLGIRPLKVSDGPVGVRGDQWAGGATSTSFPCGSALGATWDPDLVERVGAALGSEARDKGVHVVLGPTVNLHRTPLAGRNFECYSEDPRLSGTLGAAWVRGLQSQRVACTVKHFAANDQEHERMTVSAEADERTLRELYLRPFEIIVRDGGAWGVMSAYNRLGGTYCGEHPWLLTTVLRDEWGFDGFVISDWFGTHSTAAAAAGLDLEMPGPAQWFGPQLARAVADGAVAEAVVDEMVRRLLRIYDRTGALDPDDDRPSSERSVEHRALAREAAAASFVLLHDQRSVLPLDAATLRSIAVIGPNADIANVQGGGSARVSTRHEVTPLDGIRERAGTEVAVQFERGCVNHKTMPPFETRRHATGPLTVEYFGDAEWSGQPVRVDRSTRSYHLWLGQWCPEVPLHFSARVTGTIAVDESGPWSLSLVSAGRSRLWIDDELVVDNWDPQPGEFFFGMGSSEVIGEQTFEAGREYALRAEFVTTMPGVAGLVIGMLPPIPDDMMERAVAAAAAADVALVVVGTNSDWESEGIDRADLALPGRQRELIERVAAANPRTIVAVNSGAPVDLGWRADAGAVLQCWLPGQEWGDALAAVLFGDADPGGRSPTTLPEHLTDTPAHAGGVSDYPGVGGTVHYGEGVFMGYRGYDRDDITPAFCFGHGLSYATFEYGPLALSAASITATSGVVARVDVTNTSTRSGTEVVQCYVRDEIASEPRPVRELAAFAKVQLAPGETRSVELVVDARAFAFWSTTGRDWLTEPGRFEIAVGRSSRDLRATATVDVMPR